MSTTQSPVTSAPTVSEVSQTLTQSPVTGAPTVLEVSQTLTQSSVTGAPTVSEILQTPAPSPVTGAPTVSEVSQTLTQSPVTSAPTVSEVSQTLSPHTAEGKLLSISGDAIYNNSTSQYAAYQWLRHSDPAKLDLDGLSDQELIQRYVSALFYFSLDGENWIDQYGFLGEANVCEWNDGSTRTTMGIVCDQPGTIEGSRVTKYGPITGFVMSEYYFSGGN
jgi:hypothetical protein